MKFPQKGEFTMKLNEKILCCRKRKGFSQEVLAEQLGVSRQAVSKWETGEAVPEIGKLVLLAKCFDVTTDWLLSDETCEEESTEEDSTGNFGQDGASEQYGSVNTQGQTQTNWVESVPGVIGKLLRRYGWLFGVYTAVCGVGFTAVGALATSAVSRMTSDFNDVAGGILNGMGGTYYEFYDETGKLISSSVSNAATNNPVSMMGEFIMGLGVFLIIAGIILAVVLKKKSREE